MTIGPNLYAYVGNGPTGATDPLGLEQIIPFNPNALHGIGHPGFVAGSDKTGYQLRSFSTGESKKENTDNLEKKSFPNRERLVDYLRGKGYTNFVEVPSTPEEDQKALYAIDKEFGASDYNFFTHNCAAMSSTGLKANGKLKGWFNWRPRGFMLNQSGDWFWSNPSPIIDLLP